MTQREPLWTVATLLVAALSVHPVQSAEPPAPAHSHAPAAAGAAAKAPLFDNLGSYHRKITTGSEEAQRYFDQGLRLLYAFNLEEAQRSFEEAARIDPQCALCHWGVAMALGPHINLPAQAERTLLGHRAATRAVAVAAKASPVERSLIDAVSRRFAEPAPASREAQRALDSAYAEAMREVFRKFPDDPDAAALFAEALMNLRPWDLWTQDGRPQPGTAEILATLERVLARNPDHPGANHYYIHAVEASPQPEKGVAAADRLTGLMPGAGHLVHMPSHIYVRVGRWAEASEANRKAIRADRAYVDKADPRGFYLMYVAHNYQFLWSTAAMEGRSAEALDNARATLANAPQEMLRQMPGNDYLLGYPVWTLLRFGRWAEVLAEPAPPLGFPYAHGVWRAARAIAFARSGKLGEAEAERKALAVAASELPAEAIEALNPASVLLGIATHLTAGEIAAAKGDTAEAVRQLESAIRLEDGLRYNEPPDWYLPTRHTLGETLLAAGRAAEAQAVWEEDLRRLPENGWALAGLAASLRSQKKDVQAAAVEERLARAWSRADVPRPYIPVK